MSKALVKASASRAEIIERVITVGDLEKLQPHERVQYYGAVCESVGLNPLTRPFDFIRLSGKMTMYANKGCTDQLRNIHRVSVEIVNRHLDDQLGVYTVTARATKPNGRADEDVGSVVVKGLSGDALANATMKAHTKAKRRVTMSICGLSFLDESELEAVPHAQPIQVDPETGEVIEQLPRISPFGEEDPEAEYYPRSAADDILAQIPTAETMDALRLIWVGQVGSGDKVTADDKEAWHPADFKRLSKAFQKRKRELAKLEQQNGEEG